MRQPFDGAVWIGSRDYREANWKDFAGFAHTLKLGDFTVYTRLPGPVPEEQSAQRAKLRAGEKDGESAEIQAAQADGTGAALYYLQLQAGGNGSSDV